jgi:lipocalin-like protein
MRPLLLAAFAAEIALALPAVAADVSILGTYRLVSEERTIVDTKEVIPGTGARGYITYGDDGHMIVLIVRQPRPRPEGAEKITDQQRIELFRTITAYAGTYKFDGTAIEHSIEISMNEVWSGTKQVRSVKRDGDHLIYSTPPFPFHTDGKMSINTLVWEKVQ